MSLSKARDRLRKRKERAKVRLDKQLSLPRVIKTIQPNPLIGAVSPSVKREGYGKATSTVIPQVDADGNVIPDYGDVKGGDAQWIKDLLSLQ